MKNGSVNFVTLLLAAIIVAGGFYFLVYQPRHQLTPVSISPTSEMVTPTTGVNTTPTSTVDETAAVITAVKAAIVKEHGADANGLTYTVSKIDGNYAQGAASAQAGGGMWFAAKVNGTWQLVWDGNGEILCSDVAPYPDFPKTMIPECYNDKTNTMVTR